MAILINELTKSFGSKTVIKNFSYRFDDTGLYVIRGDSGSGKTTLLRIICGLDNNYKGSVIFKGSSSCSFSFQEYRLFNSLSALENVAELSFKIAGENEYKLAKKMLSTLGFSEDDMMLTPPLLSGGMKQRVSLARAFLKDSSILILDEPTKELDEQLVKTVLELIIDESKKRLVLFVSHHINDIELLSIYAKGVIEI